MSITINSRGDQEPVTTLVGTLCDQASLAGVLNSLYEFHFTLLSVEILEDEASGKGKTIEQR